MWLQTVQADRLRNLRALHLDLPGGLTVLTGHNGQGKTSLLEAIYLLGTGYSFRTRRVDDLVARHGGPLRVSGDVASRSGRDTLAVVIDGGVRRLLSAGNEVDLTAFLGRLDLVAITSEGSRLVRDGPEIRRRFLDAGVVGVRPGFLAVLAEFRRVLAERNALLRSAGGRFDPARRHEHEVWEERLAEAAARVHVERRAYAVALAAALHEPGRALFPAGEQLGLHFTPSPKNAGERPAGEFREAYRGVLVRARGRDLALGFTGAGPHRDDFRVELDGVELRNFGSAGQVRSAVIALGVGKLDLLKDRRGEAPLFLMDDFDSDLDEPRVEAVLEYLHGGGFQAVLATARESAVARATVPRATVRMVDGGVRAH